MAPIVVIASCARQEVPPGGPEDLRPPVVIRTYPAPFEVLETLDGGVRFEFDERISERVSGGTLQTAVSVSPRGGEVKVKHSRRALSVSLAEGFRAGTVYRVTLNATVSDMFGNRLQDPFELVFSTGTNPVPTTLAGEIWDRVSGRALAEAVVIATDADGLVHQARTDRSGIFAMRYIPGGSLLIQAFEDTNRNSDVDSMEVQGLLAVDLSVGDTLLVDLPVLQPDTSSAAVGGAEALDSVTVVVEFDDYLDPVRGSEGISVVIEDADGQTRELSRVFDEAGYADFVSTVADSLARLDSIDAANAVPDVSLLDSGQVEVAPDDTIPTVASPDTVVIEAPTGRPPVAGDPPAAGRPTGPGRPTAPIEEGRPSPTRLDPLQGERPGPTRDGRRILPGRRLVIVLVEPLVVEAEHEVRVSGAVNINGLGGGGGSATFVRELPEEPPPEGGVADSIPADTLAVDTVAVDTLAVVDTLVVDTLAVPTTR